MTNSNFKRGLCLFDARQVSDLPKNSPVHQVYDLNGRRPFLSCDQVSASQRVAAHQGGRAVGLVPKPLARES
jgi:hypothetical protein